MEKFINSGLLKKELSNSEEFQKAWTKNTQCSSLIPGGIREHTAALSVFLDGDEAFLKKVNNAVETLGANLTTYENDFHFKSLHFLLMDSMKLLKPKTCKTVYLLFDGKPPKKGSTVRFGGFTVGDSDSDNLPDLVDEVLLKIESCFFVSLGDHTCKKNTEVLITPAEVFTVNDVGTKKDDDDVNYTEVVLKHLELNSTHNCYMFLRPTSAQPSQAPGLLPLVPPLVVLSLWSLFI
ncbi:GPI-linked NAD(P)(+)--arginine ADP-ribosyltransferase 1 isoform X2 [Melanotaenia boesemani]|nr:GPI-linked NAD(P)(+)--arginine ADP-ribosyltransferase 1 isoform X2 [Melanotaenia boesemani]